MASHRVFQRDITAVMRNTGCCYSKAKENHFYINMDDIHLLQQGQP